MARIFLSYARADGLEIAQDLANKLRAAEHEVFLDLSSITAGTRWREEIARRIKWSDLLVVLVTEQSNDSDFVFQEITEADNLGKTIVPVQVDDTPLPVHLRGTWQSIPLIGGDIQSVQLELERTIRKLQKHKRHARRRMTITAGIAALAVIAIALFIVFGSGENPDNDSLETGTVESVAADGASGSTPTETLAGTALPSPTASVVASATDRPTSTSTATVTPTKTPTSTRTPRPTNTPIPTLTPIPESAMLYINDFEDRNLSDWDISFPDEAGFWQITAEDNGNQALDITTHPNQCTEGFVGAPDWGDYALELQFKVLTPSVVEIWFRFQDYDNHYTFASYPVFGNDIGLRRVRGNTISLFFQGGWDVDPTGWNFLHIEVENDRIRASLNGLDFPDYFDESFGSGPVGLVVCSGSSEDSRVQFDNVIIWALD